MTRGFGSHMAGTASGLYDRGAFCRQGQYGRVYRICCERYLVVLTGRNVEKSGDLPRRDEPINCTSSNLLSLVSQ